MTKISPEDQVNINTFVGQMKEWLPKCPERCPMWEVFRLLVLLKEEHDLVEFHKKLERELEE